MLIYFFWALKLVMMTVGSFSYMGLLLVLENLNIFIILISFMGEVSSQHVKFMIFIMVATLEVTVSLVVLTRMWVGDLLMD